MSRFIILTFAAFAVGFGCALWAMRGFPVPAYEIGTKPSRPAVRELTASPDVPTFRPMTDAERSDYAQLDQLIRAKLENTRSEDPANDFQRNTALREAIKYAYSPCTPFTKRAIVEAITEYVQAYQTMRGCRITYFCSPRKLELAWKAFSSDLDSEVRSAIHYAYERGGFSVADFPASMVNELEAVAGLREKTPKVCGPTPRVPYVPPEPSRSSHWPR